MELARLRHILAVGRTGSFTRAAEEERITQPALSRSVAAFEERYGAVLFDRGRGGAHPTPAGKLVLDHARRLLAAADDLERGLRLHGTGEAGRAAFGIGPLMASLLLPRLGESMLQDRPGLRIAAMVRPPEQLLPELLGNRIEMIVGNSWRINAVPGIAMRCIATLPLITVVRRDHALADRDQVFLSDLAAFPSASAVELGESFDGSGAFTCDNYHILRDTVLVTDCVWLTSADFIGPELAAGHLVRLALADEVASKTDVCIIQHKGRTLSPAAHAICNEIAAMIERLGKAGPDQGVNS